MQRVGLRFQGGRGVELWQTGHHKLLEATVKDAFAIHAIAPHPNTEIPTVLHANPWLLLAAPSS